jgi:hypothetical protein
MAVTTAPAAAVGRSVSYAEAGLCNGALSHSQKPCCAQHAPSHRALDKQPQGTAADRLGGSSVKDSGAASPAQSSGSRSPAGPRTFRSQACSCVRLSGCGQCVHKTNAPHVKRVHRGEALVARHGETCSVGMARCKPRLLGQNCEHQPRWAWSMLTSPWWPVAQTWLRSQLRAKRRAHP